MAVGATTGSQERDSRIESGTRRDEEIMRADYIQRIDLDIVETIVSRELERYREIFDSPDTEGGYTYAKAVGAMLALQEVSDKLRKHKKVRK